MEDEINTSANDNTQGTETVEQQEDTPVSYTHLTLPTIA